MSSNGRVSQPIPVSEMYDLVYQQVPISIVQLSGGETSFRDCSKSPE